MRQTDRRQTKVSLNFPAYEGRGHNKLCGSRHNMPRPSPPSVGAEAPRTAEPTALNHNVEVGSHGEYVPTATAAAA